ncbi:unnamed protein product [marine sediment metagenome]|uniref:DNA-packaging protein n=1 Tax=marine sediment metagenome TaxID=412755 RepID=X0ZWD1_9ZZZZ
MAAPAGNRFWEARSRHGRKPKFESPEMLAEACQDYFEWVEDNPLWESKLVSFQGKSKIEKLPKLRIMTQDGLCIFLDIDPSTWIAWRTHEDFSHVVISVDTIVRNQKLEGAAADLCNPNIVARLLGLKDEKHIDHSSKDGTMSPADAPLTKAEAQDLLDNNK